MCDDYRDTAARKRLSLVSRIRLTNGEEPCHVSAVATVLQLGISEDQGEATLDQFWIGDSILEAMCLKTKTIFACINARKFWIKFWGATCALLSV